MKYAKEFQEEFKKKATFTSRDVKNFFAQKGMSPQYADLMLHLLEKQGEIARLTRGHYSFNKEIQLVGHAFQPYYYGLEDALSLRNLWEQETNPVIITPRKIRSGRRTFLGQNYQVRKISRPMFFGFETKQYFEFWINVSTPEKTLIDFIYFRQPIPKEALNELIGKIDKKKLQEYLKHTPKKTRLQVQKMIDRHKTVEVK